MYKPLTISEIKRNTTIVVFVYQLVPKLNLIFLYYFTIVLFFGLFVCFFLFVCFLFFFNKKKQILMYNSIQIIA